MTIVTKILPVLLLALLLQTQTSAQTFSTPVGYLNYIGAEYTKIAKEQWDYMKAMGHQKRDKVIDKRRSDLLTAITNSKRIISRMPPYNKNSALRDTVIAALRVSHIVINEDYAKIMDMEEIAEQSYDNMEAYMLAKEKAGDKTAEMAERVQAEQARFCADNTITLKEGEENKLGKRLRQAGEVFSYENKVYLLFFKPFKQEAYMIDAMNNNDINGIEQNRNSMLNYSTDSRDKLKLCGGFKGDETLSTACRETLVFFINEGEKYVPIQIEFFTAKDKFDKIKKSFDVIKPNARTQKDVDTYNTALNEYNAASKKFNETNNRLNDLRGKALANWNKKQSDFFQKHMP